MFVIQIGSETLLESLAGFLLYKVPATVSVRDGRVHVTHSGTIEPQTQQRLLERLLWAWRIERKVPASVAVHLSWVPKTVTASSVAATERELQSR